MAGYVDLNGAKTWYDDRGDGAPLVLLHGGMNDSRCFAGNLTELADRYRVLTPERRGHGHTPDTDGPLTLDQAADDTLAFLRSVVSGRARVAGYSMCEIVALLTARKRPDLVERLILISGDFHRDGWITGPSHDAEIPDEIAARHAEVSPDGPEHLGVLLHKLADSAASNPRSPPPTSPTCRAGRWS